MSQEARTTAAYLGITVTAVALWFGGIWLGATLERTRHGQECAEIQTPLSEKQRDEVINWEVPRKDPTVVISADNKDWNCPHLMVSQRKLGGWVLTCIEHEWTDPEAPKKPMDCEACYAAIGHHFGPTTSWESKER